jgi:adenylosuccinate synthase
MRSDVIIGLQYGDEAKGKVTSEVLNMVHYDYVLRFNGGCNAGHTIYYEGQKYITHHIPAGVFHGVKSVIGPGCVINLEKLLEEIKMFQDNGFDLSNLLFIDKRAHMIQAEHLRVDGEDTCIGTTKSGNGPAYAAKANRTGIRFGDIKYLSSEVVTSLFEFNPEIEVDVYDLLYRGDVQVLCEGAQGFFLDTDWGDYPYVTSSHCGVAGAVQNGIRHDSIDTVVGVAKVYETYVGAKQFQPSDEVFNELQRVGNEIGATTGRTRQCNWLNLDNLKKAIRINGVNKVILNKIDVLQELDVWSLIEDDVVVDMGSEKIFRMYIIHKLVNLGIKKEAIFFSGSPDRI